MSRFIRRALPFLAIAAIAGAACEVPIKKAPPKPAPPTEVGPAPPGVQPIATTGDPGADGWAHQGHSLASGVYVQGSGEFAFDIYTAAFTLDANSPLVGNGWQAGHTIVGLGGVVDHDAANPNLTHSVRIVSKFSAGNDSWAPADPGPPGGSFSSQGGDGALLLATPSPASPSGNTQHLNPFASGSRAATELDPGEIHEIPILQRRESGSTVTPGAEAGKFIYLREGPDFADTATGQEAPLLSSWQVFVNVSLLDGNVAPLPQVGHPVIQTLQRSNSVNTDGFGIVEN